MARKQPLKNYRRERGLHHGSQPAGRQLRKDALTDAHGVVELGGGA